MDIVPNGIGASLCFRPALPVSTCLMECLDTGLRECGKCFLRVSCPRVRLLRLRKAVIEVGWLIIAPWPEGLVAALGRKKIFLNALFNGITLGGLYFLVASGFTLIFGLMRNVDLAHGSLYLLGGYIGYEITEWTGSWMFSFVAAFAAVAVFGIILQVTIFRWMEGQDLRQTLVTIGVSIVMADIMLWIWGGDFYQILP